MPRDPFSSLLPTLPTLATQCSNLLSHGWQIFAIAWVQGSVLGAVLILALPQRTAASKTQDSLPDNYSRMWTLPTIFSTRNQKI